MEARPKGPHTQNGDVTTRFLSAKLRRVLHPHKIIEMFHQILNKEEDGKRNIVVEMFRAFRTKRLQN